MNKNDFFNLRKLKNWPNRLRRLWWPFDSWEFDEEPYLTPAYAYAAYAPAAAYSSLGTSPSTYGNTFKDAFHRRNEGSTAFASTGTFSLPSFPSLNLSAQTKAKIYTQSQIIGTGAVVGFATKMLFVAVATSITVPGVVAVSAAALVAGMTSNIARVWIRSRITGEELEKDWVKQAIKHGFVAAATGGLIGATIAHIVPLQHIIDYAHNHIWFLQNKPAFENIGHSPQQLTIARPSLPQASSSPSTIHIGQPIASSVIPADITHSPDFDQLSPKLQQLGLHAVKTGNAKVMLHFYKEASFELLNKHGHNAALHALGADYVKHGAELARQSGLHDINARMLIRDEAYLNGWPNPDPAIDPAALSHHISSASLFEGAQESGSPVGHITSQYGWRTDPFLGTLKMHDGLDVKAPLGTPIHALAEGTVKQLGCGHGYGNCVEINDGGTTTIYGHMENYSAALHSGQHIHQGDIIGYVGNTGRSTGPHIHIGCKENGRWINPVKNYISSHHITQLLLG